ncbi:DUF6480 family protein [Saccharothrix obliqua]|uniref:DUF6480 family protein n=1 Tax=Saccharothrix obliqua TaxID=2861747 RepID=UPI001C5DDD19|nr:DUF6480 family protein [Saccharothrix obliqua]MBW4716753.1 hypothetical protein [Saccharothrix obliqua]
MTTPEPRDTPPDPDPARTPGLEPGGGVAPGDTPPDSGQTSGLSHPQPMPSRKAPIITFIAIGVATLLVVAFVIAQLVGWLRL